MKEAEREEGNLISFSLYGKISHVSINDAIEMINDFVDLNLNVDWAKEGFGLKGIIKVDEEDPSKKATVDVDGIAVTKKGDQVGNVPHTTGKFTIVDETVTVDNVPPSNLSRAQQVISPLINFFIEFNEFKPTSDSVIVQFYDEDSLGLRAILSPDRGLDRRRENPVTKNDSLKHKIIPLR